MPLIMKHMFAIALSLLLLLPSLAMAQSQIVRRPTPKSKVVGKKPTKTTGMSEAERRSILKKLVSNMVYVEGGTFTMGATAEQADDAYDVEKPAHKVTVSSFSIGKYEVTQKEWKAVMGSNPSWFSGDNLPVERMSWDNCQEFIRKLNSLTGKRFRLPTEAEWEYAARGGNKSEGYKYSGSNNLDNVAWYSDNSGETTHEVGTRAPNELGLYDMSGNVNEWCYDWKADYSAETQTDPRGPSSGSFRVIRGGSWNFKAEECRVSTRGIRTPTNRLIILGLRLAL